MTELKEKYSKNDHQRDVTAGTKKDRIRKGKRIYEGFYIGIHCTLGKHLIQNEIEGWLVVGDCDCI